MALKPVTVSQLNDYIGRLLATDPLLNIVVVKGEITSLKYHQTGHVYFSISDNESKINCFLPYEYAKKLEFMLNDGDEVVITGAVKIFKKNGSYSLNVKTIEPVGVGEMALAFEKLKKKLQNEGFFDEAHKKQIPAFPKHIGIITSKTGAAIEDIMNTLKNRNSVVDVSIFSVLVQGASAPEQIASMIDYVGKNYYGKIDSLIVGRGGGSYEDLAVFNDERIARTVYECPIPIISAVGHEIDYTICDFVADKRAKTPTEAATMIVPDEAEIREKLMDFREDLRIHLTNRLMHNVIQADNLKDSIILSMKNKISLAQSEAKRYKEALEGANPLTIMENGYSILQDGSGRMINSVSQLTEKEIYSLRLSDGSCDVRVEKIRGKMHE